MKDLNTDGRGRTGSDLSTQDKQHEGKLFTITIYIYKKKKQQKLNSPFSHNSNLGFVLHMTLKKATKKCIQIHAQLKTGRMQILSGQLNPSTQPKTETEYVTEYVS